jgi:DNA-binding beta-propeller fold protein YncE
MRTWSGLALPGAALLVCAIAVGWPMAAMVIETTGSQHGEAASSVVARPMGELLLVSAGWSLAIAASAALLGWIPGRLLGRMQQRRGSIIVAALLLAPICLPSYIAFWAWWQAWPPDSAAYAWAIDRGLMGELRAATLWIGLTCWSWPLVSWCVAGCVSTIPRERDDLLALDGVGPLRRLADHLRTDSRGLALGALIVFLVTFNSTTSFDLAEVFTFGNELRAMDALVAPPSAILAAGWPALAIAVAGTIMIWLAMGGRRPEPVIRAAPPARITAPLASLIWLASIAAPMFIMILGIAREVKPREFLSLYGSAAGQSLAIALVSGLFAAIIAAGLLLSFRSRLAWLRTLAHGQSIIWIISGLAPATILALAFEAAYNQPALAFIYQSPAILLLGHLGCFGFVAALLARWAALQEPAIFVDLSRLEGTEDSLLTQVRSSWPRLLVVGGAAWGIVAALSLSEIAVSSRIQPPGVESLAPIVLNALHYQRPETVVLAAVVMIALALIAGLVAAGASWWMRRLTKPAVPMIFLALLMIVNIGCSRDTDDQPAALSPEFMFGVNGLSLGQFSYPRAMAIDHERGFIYIVDKTARVQRVGFDGAPQLEWRMPEKENGKPTGISVAPDGRVFVADTHYFRVLVFDAEGNELSRFGSYGEEPGQFIYPTDIAFGPNDTIYVSEYGGNDRVQVFDSEWRFLFEFGSPGDSPGTAEFSRPQALAFSADFSELYIADACNHRIVVTTPRGEVLRVLGSAGREPGRFAYPYSVDVMDNGHLLVCEFGGNRIQIMSPQGASLAVAGRSGAGEGEVRYPWAALQEGELIYVLDSGNNRVQAVPHRSVWR